MSQRASIPLIAAHGLRSVLPAEPGQRQVLDGVSMELAAREIVDVVGPSGAGKTMLLRALARLLPSMEGELFLRGRPAREVEPNEWRREAVLLPQKPAIAPGDVCDNVLLPWRLRARQHRARPTEDRLNALLAEVALAGISLDRDAARLSVGQQARVALVRVLLTEPSVLLLDEPDAALDEGSAEAVRRVIRRFADSGGGVVRVRHREDDGIADRRLRLDSGRLEEVAR